MSEPSFSVRSFGDRPGLTTGNPHDDDARIIDDDFLEVDAPPTPKELPTENREHVAKRPKPTNRELIGSQSFPTGGFAQPLQILTLDARREALEVRIITTVATDYVRIGDDGNKLTTASGSFLLQAILPYKPDSYTGPVFVHGPDTTAPFVVTWYSVTS